VAVFFDPVRTALNPAQYPGRGGSSVRFFVALIFFNIALAVAIGFVLLVLFATGNL
jgi:hypothetical protein